MSDSVFTETEMAQALKEIRMREPGFDMVLFLRSLKTDVPTIIKAYLLADLPALKEHCSKQLMERFSGIIAAQQKEVHFSALNTIHVFNLQPWRLHWKLCPGLGGMALQMGLTTPLFASQGSF